MINKTLKVIPLGGLGEIGKNMMVFEYGDDIVVIDCGVLFPEEDMPGVDLVLPDIRYLIENQKKMRAILIDWLVDVHFHNHNLDIIHEMINNGNHGLIFLQKIFE